MPSIKSNICQYDLNEHRNEDEESNNVTPRQHIKQHRKSQRKIMHIG